MSGRVTDLAVYEEDRSIFYVASASGGLLKTVNGGGVLTVFAVAYLTEPMRPVLPWWSIVVANALAALLAGSYLLRRRPALSHLFRPMRLLHR